MTDLADAIIPYAQLKLTSDSSAEIAPAEALEAEVAAAMLTRVVRRAAAAAAGEQSVEPVSVAVDVTGEAKAGETIQFTTHIDRKTRTIIFANGEARAAGRPMLTAICVYRIV
ncbi:MAG: hypothetical protein AAFX03_14275 [Pseudomonadota bacterium]